MFSAKLILRVALGEKLVGFLVSRVSTRRSHRLVLGLSSAKVIFTWIESRFEIAYGRTRNITVSLDEAPAWDSEME